MQLALVVARPVGVLGPVLAQQPIGVFVGAAWPRAVRIRNEDPDREPLCQALVLSPLVASIIGQSVAQQGGHVPEPVRAPVAGTPRVYPRKPCQENPARGPRGGRCEQAGRPAPALAPRARLAQSADSAAAPRPA